MATTTHLLITLILLVAETEGVRGPTVAFHYGPSPPIDVLRHYDRVVVEPEQPDTTEATTRRRERAPGMPAGH